MPAWPATLPEYVLEGGFSEKLGDQTIESQMDSGPAKVRRRFTRALRTFRVSLMMTPAQVEDFEEFWQTTTFGGSIPFTWVHPRTRVAGDFRFRNPAPTLDTRGAGGSIIVSFQMEQI